MSSSSASINPHSRKSGNALTPEVNSSLEPPKSAGAMPTSRYQNAGGLTQIANRVRAGALQEAHAPTTPYTYIEDSISAMPCFQLKRGA